MDKSQDKTVILTPHGGGDGDGPGKGNALPDGHVLQGRYVIETQLGAGGFGITYLAKHRYLEDLWVAIKEYLPEGAALRDSSSRVHAISEQHKKIYSWGLHRFLDEARLLRQFKHPNIVSVEDFFEANDTAYMVMNYVHGRSIQADLDADRVFSEDELREILYPVLDALQLIHRDGLYHRDISPDNILLREEDDSPVLIDFGSARYEMRMRGAEAAQADQVHVPTAIFKQGYSPIEQYEGTPQGPYTDIYALGATLYRTAFRTRPIDALKRSGEIRLTKKDPLVPASEKGQGQYSTEFLRAIDAALRLEAAERPQTIAAWSKIFGITQREQAEVATLVAGKRQRPRWPAALIAVVVVAALGAGLLWYGTQPRDAVPTDVPSLLARAAKELENAPFDGQAQDRARQFYLNVLNQDRDNVRALAGYSAANTLNQFADAVSIEDQTNAAVLLVNAESEMERAGADHRVLEPGWKRIELLHKLATIREAIPALRLADDDWSAANDLVEEIDKLPGGKPLAEAARNGLARLRATRDAVDNHRFSDAYAHLADAEKAFAELKARDTPSVRTEIEQAEALFQARRTARIADLLQTADTQLQASPVTKESLRAVVQTYDQVQALDDAQSAARAGRAMLDKLLAGLGAMDEGRFDAAAQFIDSAEKIALSSDIRAAPIAAARDRLTGAQRDWSLARLRNEVETLLTQAAERVARVPLDESALAEAGRLYQEARQTSADEATLAPQRAIAGQGVELASALQQAHQAMQTGAFIGARDHLETAGVPALATAIGLDPAFPSRVYGLIDEAEILANMGSADALFGQSSLLQRGHLDAIQRHLDRVLTLHDGHARAVAMAGVVQHLRDLAGARRANDFDRAARSLQAARDGLGAAGLDAGLLAAVQQTVDDEAAAWARQQREKRIASLLQQAFGILAERPFSSDAWATADRVFRAIEAMQDGNDMAARGQEILNAIQRAHTAMGEGRFDLALQSVEVAERQLKTFGGYDLDPARTAIAAAHRTHDQGIRDQVDRHLSAVTSILNDAAFDAATLAAARRHVEEARSLLPEQARVIEGERVIGMLEQYLEALARQDFNAAQQRLDEADGVAGKAGLATGLADQQGARLAQQRDDWQRQQARASQAELIAEAAAQIEADGLDAARLTKAAETYRQAIELSNTGLADPALSKQAGAGLESVFLLQAFNAEMADRQFGAMQQTLRELADRLDQAKLDRGIVDRLQAAAGDSEVAWRLGETSRLLNAGDWLDRGDLAPVEQQLQAVLQMRPDEPAAVAASKGVARLHDMLQARRARAYDTVVTALKGATDHFAQAGLEGAGLEAVQTRMSAEQQRWSRLTRDRDLNAWTGMAVRELNQAPFSAEAWEGAGRAADKILAQQADDPRGLAVTSALDRLREAKVALDAQDFGAAQRYLAEARRALVALGLRQPLQRAVDEIESAARRASSTDLNEASDLLAQPTLTDEQLAEARARLQRILDNDPEHPLAHTAVIILNRLISVRSAIRATRYSTAEIELGVALEQLTAHSTPDESPLPQLVMALRHEQAGLAETRPNPGEIYPIVSAALGQLTRDPLNLEQLAGAERLLRNVLGMQADEPVALTGLQAIEHLRASAQALAQGQAESARTELRAAESKLTKVGLAPDTLRAAWHVIDQAAAGN